MLTYITTYYENPNLLERLLTQLKELDDDRLSLIVVDDGSTENPASEVMANFDTSNVSLYYINDDIGFNSHGARNLAMKQTATEWNVLVDLGYTLDGLSSLIDLIDGGYLEQDTVHALQEQDGKRKVLNVNNYAVTKTKYWQAGGYDPEYFGFRYGDGIFVNRLRGKTEWDTNSVLFECTLVPAPDYTKRIFEQVDINLTGNQTKASANTNNLRLVSPDYGLLLAERQAKVAARIKSKEKVNPIPFAWRKIALNDKENTDITS